MAPQAIIAVLAVLIVVGSAASFFAGRRAGRNAEQARLAAAKSGAEETSRRILAEAERESETLRKSAVVTGKEELIRLRETFESDVRGRREEVEREERRIGERETVLDRKFEMLDQRDKELGRRASEFGRREKIVAAREEELEKLIAEERRRLEQLAGLSAHDAKAELIRRLEEEAQADAGNRLREIRETARRNADREAKKIVALAIQRIAAEHTAESTVSAVSLPNDEMKGRIIGREGRNIRAFELATGVDVIIDDTPDTVVVSCFDPIRRETARLALEKLVSDGRIHPGRIEEVVNKARKEIEVQIVELGEQACYDVGVHGLHPAALQGSGVAGGDDGRRAVARREDGQARRAAARRGQGAHARARGDARAARGGGRHQVRRGPAGHQLHCRPPRRRAARDRGLGARAGSRRHLRVAPGRAT
jgi:ribonucrease Y